MRVTATAQIGRPGATTRTVSRPDRATNVTIPTGAHTTPAASQHTGITVTPFRQAKPPAQMPLDAV